MPNCPKCGSAEYISRGYPRCQCKDCGRYYKDGGGGISKEFNVREGTGVISGRVPPNLTVEQIAKHFHINTDEWEIVKIVYAEHEGFRKDREVDWEVRNGTVTYGHVRDSGKMRIEPLVGVKVYTIRKTVEIVSTFRVQDLIDSAKKYAPKYPKLKYLKHKDPVMFEIMMPDLQLGRMVMGSEAGQDLTPDKAVEAARNSVGQLLEYASLFPVETILFSVGNDFFDANGADSKTAHGTPQRDDPRWQRTYRLGKDLLVDLIDRMSFIAPVKVPVIVGNHDEERMFYMGDTLQSWYHHNPNVTIDNTEKKRKYISYGRCLIGLTHGYWERPVDLPGIMAAEEPQLWANSIFREFHLGDKHHVDEKSFLQQVKEYKGVTVRISPSLASPSVWEYDKGFFSLQSVEGFVWHPQRGRIAQFTS